MIELLKSRMEAGTVWDVPREDWEAGLTGEPEADVVEDRTLVTMLGPQPHVSPNANWDNVWSTVVDPRPENRPWWGFLPYCRHASPQ